MSQCTGIFGRWFGHNFQARYSYGVPAITNVEGRGALVIDLVEASKPTIYHGDVCTRCGLSINVSAP